jgi:type I restriction enzyme S subunit
MGGDWRQIRIGDLGKVITGRTPPDADSQYYGDGIPFLTPSDMTGQRRVGITGRSLSSYGARQLARCLVPAGVGVSCIGWQMGKSILIDRPTITNQQINSIVVNETIADTQFVYYSLLQRRSELFNLGAGGSRTPILNKGDFERLPFRLPPLPQQQAIVRIAGSFDEKIELNQNIKVAVQAMAQTVFNDWFVDFGPTRAKIEGRAPYLSPEVWQVFPAEMDSDGKPSGWAFLPLDHMANFLNGLALQKFPGTGNGDLPVIKIAELRSGITLRSDRASNQIPPAYIVEDGDVLFSWSGSLIQRIWSGGRGALNQHLFKVTSSKFPKWLHYFWVDHHLPAFQAIAASKATTMGHIQRHHLSEALTIIGDKPVMDAANNLMAPLFARLVACDLESFTLAQTRDLLLPKLMSGEIRIKEAEKAVAELV